MIAAYRNLDDYELADLIRAGDKEAYTEIYQRYFRLLFIHAWKKLQDEEMAKDVVQELFTVLWTKRETLLLNSSFAAYLFTSIRNRVLDIYAHQTVQKKHIVSLQQFLGTAVAEPDELVREKELLEYIEKMIQALPPKMREVFELSRKAGLSHKEIADKLNISEQTVAKQVSNALKILRAKLGSPLFILYLLHL